jgi:microcystin-dependent protein
MNIIFQIKVVTIVSVASIIGLVSHAQNNPNTVKGVSIAYDTLPPHPSALLDVRAVNKGVLIPRMTKAQRDVIAAPRADGLTVFVTDNTPNRGFWFWDATANGWRQLRAEHTSYPKGTILIYTGSLSSALFNNQGKGLVGTPVEGWHVCNGNNGTPDMRGMFVVGGSANTNEYQMTGNFGGEDKPVLIKAQMAKHRHGVDPMKQDNIAIPHGHDVTDNGHTHGLPTTASAKSGMSYMKRRAEKDRAQLNTSLNSTGITINENTGPINFAFPTDLVDEVGGAAPFNNRPVYYVVAYLIRTDSNNDLSPIQTIPAY